MLEHAPIGVAVLTAPDGSLGGVLTLHRCRCARDYTPRSTRKAGYGSPRPWASTATWPPGPPRLAEARVDVLVIDTAHGHQTKMLEAIRRRRTRIWASRWSPATSSAQGTRDLIGAGASIVKVGVGPGAMCTTRMMTGVAVRSSPRCSNARRQPARRTRLGRRRRAPPARRGAGAGGRCLQRDDRFLVRRHLRIPGDLLFDGTATLQGELRMAPSVPSPPGPPPTAGSSAPARHCSRRASPPPDGAGSRPRRRRGPAGPHHLRVRSTCTYVGASTLQELHERAVLGVQSAAGFAEGHPLPTGW